MIISIVLAVCFIQNLQVAVWLSDIILVLVLVCEVTVYLAHLGGSLFVRIASC